MAVASPHKLITEWLTDQAEIVPIEKSRDGQFSVNDIQGSLREFAGLFKAGYASPAMILTLHRAYPDNLLYKEVVTERDLLKGDPLVVGGPASVEMIDHEGHLITAAALSKAYDKYMENPMTRNVMVMHSDIQVGWALPAYIGRNGQVFKGGMNNKTLFFISELRKDTKISKKVTEQIYKSKMRSYSIAGSAIKTENVAGNLIKGEKPYMRVDELELAEVTICEKGVNQGASFDLIKSHDHATKSCADGSCLITKSTMSAKPHEALQTQTLSFSDYKNMLADTNGDNKSFVEMFKEYTDMNIHKADDIPEHEQYFLDSLNEPDKPRVDHVKEGRKKLKAMESSIKREEEDKRGTKRMGFGDNATTAKDFKDHGEINSRQMGFHKMMLLLRLAKARNIEMKWGQPSSADKPNTQARKQGMIRGVSEKAGDAAKKEFQQKEFIMNDADRQAIWETLGASDEVMEKGLRSSANKLKNKYNKSISGGERKYKKSVVDSLRSKTRRAARAEGETGTTATEQARTQILHQMNERPPSEAKMLK